MTEVLLCNQTMHSNQLESQCGVKIDSLIDKFGVAPKNILGHTPYLMCEAPLEKDKDILKMLPTGKTLREITNMTLYFGEDNTLAIAEISERLKSYNINAIGASTSVYGQRLKGFGEVVKQYQDALMDYRAAMQNNNRSSARVLARQRAVTAFQKMQMGFKHEMSAVTSGIKAGRRGLPLTNVNRGINIARSSRNVATLNISSRVQASQLARFGSQAKFLGNGLILIDVGSRVGNIHTSYKAGENWERELFIESSSFGLSAIVGTYAVNAGVTILLAASPVGWVVLIAGGLAVAGAAAGASMGMNSIVKENAGSWYDSIMNVITE